MKNIINIVFKNTKTQRVDLFLTGLDNKLSRTRIKNLILAGFLSQKERKIADPSHKVKVDEEYSLVIPPSRDPKPKGEKIDLEIIFEDSDLIVINKQKGLVVHPAPGNPNKTLVTVSYTHLTLPTTPYV